MSIQSDSSQISNGLETINDVSELDEDSPNPHGKTKIVWEEESEDLECSNLYSSDQGIYIYIYTHIYIYIYLI